jgi:hypothetical protein
MRLLVARCYEALGMTKKCKKNIQPKEGKREKRLVNPAHHNTSIFFPVLNIAVILQRRTHVPGQKAPADSPN